MSKAELIEEIHTLFGRLHHKRPLIHHLTNGVTINDCANVTLAAGGSPVMASHIREAEEMAGQAQSLVINIGTFQEETYQTMIIAGKKANSSGIPVIFDPVGAGGTKHRTERALEFLNEVEVAVIRANKSELQALCGKGYTTRGVDNQAAGREGEGLAFETASLYNCVAVASGKEDVVSDGSSTYVISNGHPLLAQVTGTGCMSTSLAGCFSGITDHYLAAAIAGISTMGIAGEQAASSLDGGEGIGTFKVRLIDYLSLMEGKGWKEGIRIHEQSN